MVQRFAGQLARLGDVREAQMHSGDAIGVVRRGVPQAQQHQQHQHGLDRPDSRLPPDFAAPSAMPTSN